MNKGGFQYLGVSVFPWEPIGKTYNYFINQLEFGLPSVPLHHELRAGRSQVHLAS